MTEVRVLPLAGIPEISPGDDLSEHLASSAHTVGGFEGGDVCVITQKVVSKAEGRLVAESDRRATAVRESKRILRRAGEMIISETHHGFVCANAGVDASNVEEGYVALLPLDPDLSARRLRARLMHLTDTEIAVVISDTFGRAWRIGQTDVAIGVAGIDPFVDYRGTRDTQGRELTATRIAIADEIAGAAELVMGKTAGVCAAIVRGAPVNYAPGNARSLVRPPAEDFFR